MDKEAFKKSLNEYIKEQMCDKMYETYLNENFKSLQEDIDSMDYAIMESMEGFTDLGVSPIGVIRRVYQKFPESNCLSEYYFKKVQEGKINFNKMNEDLNFMGEEKLLKFKFKLKTKV